MPKHKTRKSAAKRFKVTKSGKVLHRSQQLRHLRSEKSKTYYGKNIWFEIGKQYNFEKWLPDNTIVYGEIYGKHNGSNVQDLTYGLDHLEFAVFDIKQDGKYLNWFDVKEFCEDYLVLQSKICPLEKEVFLKSQRVRL